MTHSFNSCAKIAFQIVFNFITCCLACACANTGGSVLMLVMIACGNLASTWIFLTDFLVDIYEIFNINKSSNHLRKM